jgi:sporulation protein YlmC with PRC-barrel domain
MSRIIACAAALACATVALAPAAFAAPAATQAPAPSAAARANGPEIEVLPASGLVVRPVVDRNGRDAGRVNAVVIDTANGVVEYVLLEGRGGFNLNGELIALPWSLLEPPTLKDPLRLNITVAQLENAPRIKRDVLYRLNEQEWRARVYGYFGSPYPSNTSAGWYGIYGPLGGGVTRTRPAAAPRAAAPAAATRRQADETAQRPLLRHLSPGIGLLVTQSGGIAALVAERPAAAPVRPAAAAIATSTEIFAPNGTAIGHIEQILVAPRSGRVAFVLIGKGGMLGVAPVVYPLPIQVLRWSEYRDAYRLVVDPKLLAKVPATPLGQAKLSMWVSEPALARLYRHFGTAPASAAPATHNPPAPAARR